MKTIGMLAAVVLVGCGPAWEGTFVGTLGADTTCNDGSRDSQSLRGEWAITEGSTGALVIVTNGGCSPLTATPAGSSATIGRRTCPDFTSGDITLRSEIPGGTVRIREPTIDVDFKLNSIVFYQGSPIAACVTSTTGSLVRQD